LRRASPPARRSIASGAIAGASVTPTTAKVPRPSSPPNRDIIAGALVAARRSADGTIIECGRFHWNCQQRDQHPRQRQLIERGKCFQTIQDPMMYPYFTTNDVFLFIVVRVDFIDKCDNLSMYRM
jgi:hypothetical protein